MSKSHKAPKTLALIVSVNDALRSNRMTNEDLRAELNRYLPKCRQIQATHAGITKLNRWLNPTGAQWCEPRAEIALALQEWLETKKK